MNKKNTAHLQKSKNSLLENNLIIYSILGLVILLVIAARLHLLSFPLERDEGEYAYMGKLILEGHTPYSLAYNMKYPGMYYMYAAIMAIFGKSITGIHLGLLLIVTVSTVLLFSISKNFISKTGAIIAAASFGIIGTSRGLLGQAAHATHFVVFFALLGLFFILQTYNKQKYKTLNFLLAGVFFAFAFICKQSGLFFVFAGYTIILIKDLRLKPLNIPWKNLLFLTLGFIVPVFLMFFTFYMIGIFDKFWFWTFTYLSEYGTQIPISDAFNQFRISLSVVTINYSSQGYIILWLMGLIGIPMIFMVCKTYREKLMVLLFLLFSFMTIIPGFYFRQHYFITLLPAIALLTGLFFDFFNRLFLEKLKRPNLGFISLLIFFIIILQGVKANEDYLFKTDTKKLCNTIYGGNPFAESIQLGKYIKQNSTPKDKIAILGSEPQILFYADRYSATGYLYMYNLMEVHPYAPSMQKEMIEEIETNSPKYIIYVSINISWVATAESDKTILEWAQKYINRHYKLVGFMDVLPRHIAKLELDKQINEYQPKGQLIFLFERVD